MPKTTVKDGSSKKDVREVFDSLKSDHLMELIKRGVTLLSERCGLSRTAIYKFHGDVAHEIELLRLGEKNKLIQSMQKRSRSDRDAAKENRNIAIEAQQDLIKSLQINRALEQSNKELRCRVESLTNRNHELELKLAAKSNVLKFQRPPQSGEVKSASSESGSEDEKPTEFDEENL